MPETEQNTEPLEGTTTPETEQQVESFDREYVEKLRRENASYRQRAKEAQEAAEAAKLAAEREKLDEVERLKAEKADLEKAAAEAAAKATAAERRAALTGKVADPVAALKLLDETQHLNEDGSVNTDALLKTYPFLAVTPAGPTPVAGAGGTLSNKASQLASLQERLGKATNRVERAAIQRQLHELQKGK